MSCTRALYRNHPQHDQMPSRLFMTIEQWVRQGENKLKVTFDYDNEFDILTLNELLLYELKLCRDQA